MVSEGSCIFLDIEINPTLIRILKLNEVIPVIYVSFVLLPEVDVKE